MTKLLEFGLSNIILSNKMFVVEALLIEVPLGTDHIIFAVNIFSVCHYFNIGDMLYSRKKKENHA